MCVASSGITTLLDGRVTAHSALKLLLNLHLAANPLCNLVKSFQQGTVLKTCQLIIYEECTVRHKKGIEAIESIRRDFRSVQHPMDGALILPAGDFRQTLPIIPRSTPANQLNAGLKNSVLWTLEASFK